jgi:hypothetical protein
VYDHLITTLADKPKANHTYHNFQAHVNLQDDARLENLTAHMAGFHAANGATAPPPAPRPATNESTLHQANWHTRPHH